MESLKSKFVLRQKSGLTKRAADKWESARFSALFVASSSFRFDSESTLRPLAANASR